MSLAAVEAVRFEQIRVGRVFQVSECFGHSEMDRFADLSGDHSAIHSDPETAKRFGFRDRLQYGFLLASLLSRIVGTNFEHAICTSVSMDFVNPAIAGEHVEVRAEVTQVQETMRSVALKIAISSEREVIARGKLITVFLT